MAAIHFFIAIHFIFIAAVLGNERLLLLLVAFGILGNGGRLLDAHDTFRRSFGRTFGPV